MADTMTRTVKVPGDFTAGQLAAKLRDVPSHAVVTVRSTPGDRPFDGGETALVFTWTEVMEGGEPHDS